MGRSAGCLSPFTRQCFVVMGVVLNMAQFGMVMGYTPSLLMQLAGSSVNITDSAASWIAAIVGVAILPSNFIVASIMNRYGRKVANIISVLLMITGWLMVCVATSVPWFLTARFIQGFSLGMGTAVGPVMVGECTTPKYRGSFLGAISLAVALGSLLAHSIGLTIHFQKAALVIGIISFVTLLLILYSPESPSWLIEKGRTDEGIRSFRWLRGDDEEDELQIMLKVNLAEKEIVKSSLTLLRRIKGNLVYFCQAIPKKEFYKPILIVVHLYLLSHWSGVNSVIAFGVHVVDHIVGDVETYAAPILISVGIQRMFSNSLAVYIAYKLKRKVMLLLTVSFNVLIYLVIAAYVYSKNNGLISFGHPFIGIILIHLLVFSFTTGAMPLQFIIAGEIFPLEYRGMSSAICALSMSPALFLNIKTKLFLFKEIGLHGAFVLYAGVCAYCLLVIYVLLPETKGKTLHEIEDELKGKTVEERTDFAVKENLILKETNVQNEKEKVLVL